MLKQILLGALATAALTAGVGAQARPATTPAPRPPAEPAITEPRADQPGPPRAPEPLGQPVNIKLEITITDGAASADAARKSVTMLIADRSSGSVRSNGQQRVTGGGSMSVAINVDAEPMILRDGSIRLKLALEYQPKANSGQADEPVPAARLSMLTERLSIILQDGKPLVISQAADPGSDRKVAVELKASVVK